MIRIHNLKSALLALAVPLALASCSFDGDYDDCPDTGGVKTVRLQITANDPAAVNDTRFSPPAEDIEKQEPGTKGEYINSLDIFIVGANDVVAFADHRTADKLDGLTADELDGDAATGDLKTYTSDAIELTDGGSYTVYAFANMSTTYSSDWADIASIAKGGTLSKATLDAIVLNDPAGNLNFTNGHFIPMSATETITDLSSPIIEVSLDRLVSKIRLAIKKDTGVNVTSLKISGWADKVSLMDNADASASPSGTAFDCDKVFSDEELDEFNAAGTYDFYVNETPQNHHFTVEVKTKEQGSPVYTATTARDNLPRNCIYPLTLNLNTLDLQLTAQFWFNAIGVHIPVGIVSENEFDVDIPDGMEFELQAALIGGDQAQQPTYKWTLTSSAKDVNGVAWFDDSNQSVTSTLTASKIKGILPALGLSENDAAIGPYTLQLDVTWGTTSTRRSYTVNVSHIWFDEAHWIDKILNASTTRAAAASYLQPETLNMVINH